MMHVKELSRALDERIPRSLSCDWDNDGLLCAPEPEREVRRVLCALDVTPAVAQHAIDGGFDVILSHHPLIFHPLRSLDAEGSEATVVALLRAGISVLSYHTRLDAAPGGVADRLAWLLGLRDVVPVVEDGEGVLRIGEINESELHAFALAVKTALGAPVVLSASAGRPVHRVALSPGDGKDFVLPAVAAGADTFLTGRLSYNILCDAPKYGINLIEAGHYFTERHITQYLAQLAREFCGAETEVYESLNIDIL